MDDRSQDQEVKTLYVLITQCLQNGFFLDHESTLSLPVNEVLRVLVGSPLELEVELKDPQDETVISRMRDFLGDEFDTFKNFVTQKWETRANDTAATAADEEPKPRMVRLRELFQEYMDARIRENPQNRRLIPEKLVREGPLYQFLNAAINDPNRRDELHVVHITDWHTPSQSYDEERRRYGAHCEAGTWAAEPLDGFEDVLQPWKGNTRSTNAAHNPERGYRKGRVVFHAVKSDSVFDFKPPFYERGAPNLENRFDVDDKSDLTRILDRLITSDQYQHIYMVVIGIYTDIKIQILLTSLRSRYPIDNLIVSDVLTAAPSLERHLAGLDFASRVLNVEVMHSLNELVHAIQPGHTAPSIPQAIIANSVSYRDTRNYFLDKQNLLAYQEKKQLEYLELTKRRATRVYKQIFMTNQVLIGFGVLFLLLTFISAWKTMNAPEDATGDYLQRTLLLGGLSLAQLIVVFFRNPMSRLQENLNNLVRLHTTLETQSLVTALMRYHFSKPERLFSQLSAAEEDAQLNNVEKQIGIIEGVAVKMNELFGRIEAAQSDDDVPPSGGS